MGLHNAYAVKYGSTVIAGLQQLNAQTNPNVEAESGSGSPFPQFAVITSQRPRMMFNTKMAAAVLGLTGLTGAVIDGTNSLIGYFASLAPSGLPAAGTVHRSYTAVRGLLYPRRISCSARGNLSVDAEAVLFSSDGATHPIAVSDAVALPAITPANILHGIGPITLGVTGTTVTAGCLQDVSIDFGASPETLGCGSDLYDMHLQLTRVAPVITLRGIDAAVFAAAGGVPAVGQPLTHAATKIYFRKRNTTGVGFVADATAEHIKLTANGVAVVTEHTGQGTSRAEVSIQITTAWDGTNAPVTINTASAIT